MNVKKLLLKFHAPKEIILPHSCQKCLDSSYAGSILHWEYLIFIWCNTDREAKIQIFSQQSIKFLWVVLYMSLTDDSCVWVLKECLKGTHSHITQGLNCVIKYLCLPSTCLTVSWLHSILSVNSQMSRRKMPDDIFYGIAAYCLHTTSFSLILLSWTGVYSIATATNEHIL